jgi:type VI secretion system secreted protein Hcp
MAVDMFLLMKEAAGESKDKQFKDAIEVVACQWNVSQASTASSGGGAGAGKPDIAPLLIHKYLDKSSALLAQFCCAGKHLPEAKLVLRKAGGDEQLVYLTYTLTSVFVKSYSISGSPGDERPTEAIALDFAKYVMCYQPQNDKGGKEGGEVCAGWDQKTNEKA